MFDAPAPARTIRSLFGAFVVVLGAQSMRFLFGSITWYLRDTVGIGVTDLIPIALAPFALGAVLPIVSRWLSVRTTLWIGLWALILSRSLLQLAVDPAIEFWMSAVGVAAFVGLLPLLLSMGRSALVGGLLLGIALDSAIKGLGLSLDIAYQSGPGTFVMVVSICLAAIWSLWSSPPIDRQGVGWGDGVALIGIGPVLFVQFLILQNQGWTSEVAGIGAAQAQLRIALLNVVALILVTWLGRNRFVALVGLAVLVAAVLAAEGGELAFNILSLLAIPAAGLVWAALVGDPEPRGLLAQGTYLTLGMVLFVAVGLLYYVPLDLDLGFTSSQVRVAAAVLIGVIGLVALFSASPTRPGASSQTWAFAGLAAILPLLGFFVAGQAGESVPPDEGPVRVMTYNIHSAYNVEGRFDIDAIAEVIEASGASIVGLQEVPRGRLISGVTDELAILKQRLGFDHDAFFGTTDPTWGNAILSKYPIVDVERAYLPLVGTPMRRGYLGSSINTPAGNVLFISTHLQHVNDSSVHDEDPETDLYPVHQAQIDTIMANWGGREPAVLVGDFNARPDWQQIDELLAEGWVDSWATAGSGPGFTASSDDPRYRIDYVFHTPDLQAVDAGVLDSTASDHLPVVVDLAPVG